MSEDCKDEIEDKLGFEFERDMFFDFEISENYEDEEFDEEDEDYDE